MRPEYDIDKRKFFAQICRSPLLLRHAASYSNQETGFALFQFFQSADIAIGMVFGIFPNTAGVENNNIRIPLFGAFRIAARMQDTCNFFRFMHIHLAAVSYNPILFFHVFIRKKISHLL